MSAPIKSYKKGKIQLNIWENYFDGKKSYSYSIDKNYYDKQNNTWKKTTALNQTDLQDIYFLITVFFNNYIIKNSEKKQQPSQTAQNINNTFDGQQVNNSMNDIEPEDIPF